MTAKGILKPNYAKLIDRLDLPKVCNHLYEKDLVKDDLKEKIEKSTRQEANKLYIDFMITNSTISTVKRFADTLINTSEALANEVHKEIGEDLLAAINNQRKATDYKTSLHV